MLFKIHQKIELDQIPGLMMRNNIVYSVMDTYNALGTYCDPPKT